MELHRPDLMERNRSLFVIGVVVLISVAVLFPGRLPPENRLRWRDPSPGLRFGGIAQALSERPIVTTTGGLTFEIWLAPGFVPGVGNQEILSFYDEEFIRPLLLGQFPRGFILRGREDNPKGDPRDDYYIRTGDAGLENPSQLRHLAVTVGASGARLHVNGEPTRLVLPMTQAQPGTPFGGHLMLGSSSTGWPHWSGGMLGVSVHERELSQDELRDHARSPDVLTEPEFFEDGSLLALYRFDEGQGDRTRSAEARGPELHFPDRITRPTRPNMLSVYSFGQNGGRWLPTDVVLNVLGFIPLGIAFCWRRRSAFLWLALAAGFSLSLSLEVMQSVIPGRSSSMVDLLSNSVGVLAGGLLTRFWPAR